MAYTVPGAGDPAPYFDNGYGYQIENSNAHSVKCSIGLGDVLICQDTQGSITTEQGDVLYLGDGTVGTGTTLVAVPA